MAWPSRPLGFALALLLAAACSDDTTDPGWQVVHEDLDGALFSVWAGSSTEVWAVGGDAGSGPEVLRYDGVSWEKQATGLTGDLWWVFGFAGGPVFVGGEGGLIARTDEAGALQPMTTPGTGTVFGIWGTSPTNMWAVGGDLGGAGGAFAWRLDGEEWIAADGFPSELAATDAVWKVYGTAPDDVWMVGTNGLVLHYDGDEFATEDAGVSTALFTVHGTRDRLMAVGGFAGGVLVERTDGSWRDVSPDAAGQLIGVYAAGDQAYAVGADGLVYRRDPADGAWNQEPTGTGVYHALHAVCIDDAGGVWAVGGQIQAAPFVNGVMLHRGDEVAGGL